MSITRRWGLIGTVSGAAFGTMAALGTFFSFIVGYYPLGVPFAVLLPLLDRALPIVFVGMIPGSQIGLLVGFGLQRRQDRRKRGHAPPVPDETVWPPPPTG